MADYTTDYLIIGNSAAGVSAAETIHAVAPDSSVMIVGNEPYPAYGRPLISYLIEGKTTEDALWLHDNDFYERIGTDVLLGHQFEVNALNAEAHEATLANGRTVQYGACLIATGSIPFTPPIDGLEGAANAFAFMCLDDARALWDAVRDVQKSAERQGRPSRVIVVGAGLIGLKAAEAVAGYVDEVVVLELAPRILPAVLDTQGATTLQALLAAHGIDCRPGVSVQRFERTGGEIVRALLTDGTTLDCDVVVAAVGVRPNVALAAAAGAQHERGLVCDERLQTSLPDVYAAGDVVQDTDVLDGSQHPLALWPNAVRHGRLAGRYMADSQFNASYEGSFAVNAVDFFDVSLLTAGTINPPEELLADGVYQQQTFVEGDTYAKFVFKDNRLVGYILLNRPDNAGIYTALIENGVSLEDIDETLFRRPPENLDLSDEQRWKRLHKGYPSTLNRTGSRKERA